MRACTRLGPPAKIDLTGIIRHRRQCIERIKREIGRPVTVVATGGLATLFDKHTEVFDAIEPDLTIQGLSLLYDMAMRAPR